MLIAHQNINSKKKDYNVFLLYSNHRFIVVRDFYVKHINWGSLLIINEGREHKKAITRLQLTFNWITNIIHLLNSYVLKKVSKNLIDMEDNYNHNSDHLAI